VNNKLEGICKEKPLPNLEWHNPRPTLSQYRRYLNTGPTEGCR